MARRDSPLIREDYTVAWLTAIPTELTASESILDERHPPLDRLPHDSNSYILGRIGKHNVVMTSLPSGNLGMNAAAIAAAQMMFSFPSIEIRVLVGISGGIPSPKDVRLGDVVVSVPGDLNRGVLQHDFGKFVADGELKHTHILDGPPPLLLNAVTRFRASNELYSKFLEGLSNLINADSRFAYPGLQTDLLFKSTYPHVHGETSCEKCDLKELIQNRPERSSTLPFVHYGGIASGNQLTTSTKIRDRLGEEHGVLCLEMEAAALMNHFPCLVVRGISDYADSHKNKIWKFYSAAAAAVYAKTLINTIPPQSKSNITGEALQGISQMQSSSNDRGMALTVAHETLAGCIEIGRRVARFFRDYASNPDSDFQALALSFALANDTTKEFQRSLVGLSIEAHSKIPQVFDRLALLFGQLDALLCQYTTTTSTEISKARWAKSGKHSAETIKAEIDKWLTQIYPMVLTHLVRVGIDEILQQKAKLQGISDRIEGLHTSVQKLPGIQEGAAMLAVQEAMNYSSSVSVQTIRVRTSLHTIVIDLNEQLELRNPNLSFADSSPPVSNFQLAEFVPETGETPIQVIVEHRQYNFDTKPQVRGSTNYIAHVITNANPEHFNIPKCFGFYENTAYSRYSLLLGREFTVQGLGTVSATPYTLEDAISILQSLRRRKIALDEVPKKLVRFFNHLESRKVFGIQLVRALSYIHSVNLLHKSIRSSNVVLCLDRATSTHVIPLLIGFHLTRRVTDSSTNTEDEDWNAKLYRHPARWQQSGNSPFIHNYDVYSLGVVLLELGLCESVASIAPLSEFYALGTGSYDGESSGVTEAVSQVSAKVVDKFLITSESRLEPKQGETFFKVVRECLNLGRQERPDNSEVLSFILESLLSIKY